ncbi:hypothetical protein ACFZCK_04390 [Kitasatospora purpeofusca]|uniref:hypothetical protein n=1 Tax=Kitasatospora purpeofusca TaxID=67352 RepID=UPI0036DFB55D
MPRLFGFADAARKRLNDAEAAVLANAASRRLADQPWPQIADWVFAEGHRSTMGGRMRPATLAEILANPAIAGLARDENGELVDVGEPRAISRETFERLEQHNQAKRPASRNEDREYLLTGEDAVKFVCGLCGTPISSAPSNSGTRGYRCAPSTRQHPGGCGKVRLSADLGEPYVVQHVLAELAKPEVQAVIQQVRDTLLAERPSIEQRLAENRSARRTLESRYGKSPVLRDAVDDAVPATVEAARRELVNRLHEAQRDLDRLIEEDAERLRFLNQLEFLPRAEVPDLIRWWQHAPMRSKRAIIGAMLSRIAIYPAGRGSRTVDGDRVALDWRVWDEPAAPRT